LWWTKFNCSEGAAEDAVEQGVGVSDVEVAAPVDGLNPVFMNLPEVQPWFRA
jgi:hypothetical protein